MPAQAPPAPGLGARLRDARNALGLSTADVGELVGVHQTTVSAWERGNQKSSIPRHSRKLAATLGLEEETIRRLWWDEMGRYLAWLEPAA